MGVWLVLLSVAVWLVLFPLGGWLVLFPVEVYPAPPSPKGGSFLFFRCAVCGGPALASSFFLWEGHLILVGIIPVCF